MPLMADQSALTPDLGVSAGAWNAIVRRARIGRERKAVALVVSSYANADGTGIHCGMAALAVDCEIGYSTARRYLAWLRTVGLIELVRHGNQRKGLSDEYRLILGPDLMEHIEIPDPVAYKAAKDRIRDANRTGQKARRIHPDQRSPKASAEPAQPDQPSALPIVSAETADQRSPREPSALTQDEPPPSLYTYPEEHTSPKPPGDIRTEAADPCARDLPEEHSDLSIGEVVGPVPPSLRLVDGNPTAPPNLPGLWPAPAPAALPPVGSRRWSSRGTDAIAEASARMAAARAAHAAAQETETG